MRHQTECKFCRKPIFLEIDDAYAGMRDPYKLVPMASCNRCADLRVRKRTLEERISRTCMAYFQHLHVRGEKGPEQSEEAEVKQVLVALTKKYTEWFGEFSGISGYLWDMELVNLLMDRPKDWQHVIVQYCGLFRSQAHNQPNPNPTNP